jgi:hypothetical protein
MDEMLPDVVSGSFRPNRETWLCIMVLAPARCWSLGGDPLFPYWGSCVSEGRSPYCDGGAYASFILDGVFTIASGI